MSKFAPISGFPEWLPEQRMFELQCLDTIRREYELYGFANIETRSVEPTHVLTGNGDDKEIYVLARLHEEAGPIKSPAELGLRFDLTVPTARYVQQFRGQLSFPFKRYQMQKVWRGERPQEGRYREFMQCDIDVIGDGSLPSYYDAEVVRLMAVVTSKLPIPPITLRVNNRKLLQGFYEGLGIADTAAVLRMVDKLDKIGAPKVSALLQTDLHLTPVQADQCLAIAAIKTANTGFVDRVRALGISTPLLEEGLAELTEVLNNAADLNASRLASGLTPSVLADLSIARGLAYYTGMVCEGQMQGFESSGSVCGGGRYDNLAADAKVKLPGVGVSIGLTRILGLLFAKGVLKPTRKTPTDVLVALNDEASRPEANTLANRLRGRGIATDIYHTPKAYGKQIEAASKRGIPFVWFVGHDTSHEVKNLLTGEQVAANPETWSPG